MKVGDLVRYATEYDAERNPAAWQHGVIVGEGAAITTGTIWHVFWSFPEGPKTYGVHDRDIEVVSERR